MRRKRLVIFILLLASILIVSGCNQAVGGNIRSSSGSSGSGGGGASASDYCGTMYNAQGSGTYAQVACSQDSRCKWDADYNKCINVISTTRTAPVDSIADRSVTTSLTKDQKLEVLNMLSNCESVELWEKKGSGVGAFLAEGLTPKEYCINRGFGSCLLVQNEFEDVVFESKNGTCDGEIKYKNRITSIDRPADCNTGLSEQDYYLYNDLTRKQAQCNGGYSLDGDYWASHYMSVICCSV